MTHEAKHGSIKYTFTRGVILHVLQLEKHPEATRHAGKHFEPSSICVSTCQHTNGRLGVVRPRWTCGTSQAIQMQYYQYYQQALQAGNMLPEPSGRSNASDGLPEHVFRL